MHCCTLQPLASPRSRTRPSSPKLLGGPVGRDGIYGWFMGGCQNDGPFLEAHIKGDVDIDVDVDTDSIYGWLSRLWSLFGSLV